MLRGVIVATRLVLDIIALSRAYDLCSTVVSTYARTAKN